MTDSVRMDLSRPAADRRTALSRLSLVVPVVLFVVDVDYQPGNYQTHLQFAKIATEFARAVAQAGNKATTSLVLDTVFLLSFVASGMWFLSRALPDPGVPHYRFAGLRGAPVRHGDRYTQSPLPYWLVWLPLAAGGLDFIENVMCLYLVRDGVHPGWLVPVIEAVAIWKFVAYAVAVFVILTLLLDVTVPASWHIAVRAIANLPDHLPLTGSHAEQVEPADEVTAKGIREQWASLKATARDARDGGDDIAICLSGGGIRAASVGFGALRGFDKPRATGEASLFQRARWLCAVSGGGYIAAGWWITRGSSGELVDPNHDGLFDQNRWYANQVRNRRRYLSNPRGGLTVGLLEALGHMVVSLAGVVAIAELVGVAAGAFVRSLALFPGIADSTPTNAQLHAAAVILPSALPFGIGVVAFCVAGAMQDGTRRGSLTAIGRAGVAVGVVLGVLMLGLPALLVTGHRYLSFGNAKTLATTLLAAGGLTGTVVGLLTARLKKRWSRLGGVLLALLLGIFAVKVAEHWAYRRSAVWTWSNVWLPVAAVVVLAGIAYWPAHRFTLNGVYRKRLAGTFALREGGARLSYSAEKLWRNYPFRTPELVSCLTQHSTVKRADGLPAAGLVCDNSGVTSYLDDGMESFVAWEDYPTGSWWEGYPRGWITSRIMALSGAAFGSAMGRQALGSTNALLAAANLRLGIWIPNPHYLDRRYNWKHTGNARAPRVSLHYFVRELLGQHRPEQDPFVLVSDGGNRENLGLVEILRRRPTQVFVIDASGDKPGSFTTLRQAVELARVELDVTIDVETMAEYLNQTEAGFPKHCAVAHRFRYPGGAEATLYYARYQICDDCPRDLIDYATRNHPFPDFGLGNQFLSEEQFERLGQLGEHMAQELMALATSGG